MPARTRFKIIASSIVLVVVACTLAFGSLISLFLLLVDEPSERAGALKAFKESPAMQGFLALIFIAILVSTIRRTLRSIREEGVRGTLEDEALDVCICFGAGAIATMPVKGPASATTGGGSFGGGGASGGW